MNKKFFFLLFFVVAVSISTSSAQDKKLVQFSGMVIHADSLEALPFVNIINISRKYKGTYTDMRGYF
jgi:hypothetical protein